MKDVQQSRASCSAMAMEFYGIRGVGVSTKVL
jgi:hypothetical protein